MDVEVGYIYFVKQSFFDLVDDNSLPKNKPSDESGEHNRPAFCAIKADQGNFYWVIPFSHQVEKYQKIYDKSMAKYKRCDTLEFGYVLGEKKAFLIQNMFPITQEYLNNIYIDQSTKKPIELSSQLKNNLRSKANKVISLYKRQGIKLIFTDIEGISKKLDIKIS